MRGAGNTTADTEKLTAGMGRRGIVVSRAHGTLRGPRDRDIESVIVAAVLNNGKEVAPHMGSGDRNIKTVIRAPVASRNAGIPG